MVGPPPLAQPTEVPGKHRSNHNKETGQLKRQKESHRSEKIEEEQSAFTGSSAETCREKEFRFVLLYSLCKPNPPDHILDVRTRMQPSAQDGMAVGLFLLNYVKKNKTTQVNKRKDYHELKHCLVKKDVTFTRLRKL